MEEWLKIIIPLISVAVPLVVAIVAWCLNECSKRKWENHKRKEDRYEAFLKSIYGFYATSENTEKKENFLQEFRLSWLYCPDAVIRTGNAFLDTVATGAKSSDEKKEKALTKFELALRRDLHGKTELTVEDHRNWRST